MNTVSSRVEDIVTPVRLVTEETCCASRLKDRESEDGWRKTLPLSGS